MEGRASVISSDRDDIETLPSGNVSLCLEGKITDSEAFANPSDNCEKKEKKKKKKKKEKSIDSPATKATIAVLYTTVRVMAAATTRPIPTQANKYLAQNKTGSIKTELRQCVTTEPSK
jgi:hypothetical protein